MSPKPVAVCLAAACAASVAAPIEFSWDHDGLPPGVTYELEANGASAQGISTLTHTLETPGLPGDPLEAQVRAIAPAGFDCSTSPPGECPESAWAMFSGTVPVVVTPLEQTNVVVTRELISGLVAHYMFSEGSGTTVVDASGNGNTGTLSGATWITTGKFGNAISFDGVNDGVAAADSASLDLNAAVTLEAWIFPSSIPDFPMIVGKVNQDGTHVSPFFAYALTLLNTAKPRLWVNAGGSSANVAGPDAIPLNTWTHLAGVYDGANLKLYVNGVEKASAAKTGTILNTAGSLKIGVNGADQEPFAGKIDEVRIYNRALNATEIADDMAAE